MSKAPIGLALLGAGIWARDQHLPAILENRSVALKAIYSRSQESASKLAAQVPFPVQIYYDVPASPNSSLEALLARSDITACILCLPILVQLSIVKKCLQAGKHTQSEKPIAGDVATAAEFIDWFRNAQASGEINKDVIWGVGEENRLMPCFDYMRDEVPRLGRLMAFYLQGYMFMKATNPFYETSWRKVPGYQGGFLLDGGVHWTASLLHVLGNAPANRIAKVSAFGIQLHEHLAPIDTIHAIIQLESGISGVFGYSAGIEHKEGKGPRMEMICERGRVTYSMDWPKNLGVVTTTEAGKPEVVKEFDSSNNCRHEVATFVKSILAGKEEEGERPEGALNDLALLQTMLESAKSGGVVQKLQQRA